MEDVERAGRILYGGGSLLEAHEGVSAGGISLRSDLMNKQEHVPVDMAAGIAKNIVVNLELGILLLLCDVPTQSRLW
jgi:hypothetical protein